MEKLTNEIQKQLNLMSKTGKLFRSNISGDELWNIYLKSFEKEDDPIFRDPESSVHNCNLCKNFMRRYGNIVAIDHNTFEIITLFDFNPEDKEYSNSVKKLSENIKQCTVKEVFFETISELSGLPYGKCKKGDSIFKLGIPQNTKRYTRKEALKYGIVKENEIRTFRHLHMDLRKDFVDLSGDSIESIMSKYRASKEVFKRAMDEISIDTLETVYELIDQDSILNGKSYLEKLEKIKDLKKIYQGLPVNRKNNWAWVMSYNNPYSKFRNELIGTLCIDLEGGKSLEEACLDWNKRADPSNYMKAKSPITSGQKDLAKKYIEDNGYEESFYRRCATIDDIKASEILHMSAGNQDLKKVSIFDSIKPDITGGKHKKSDFDKVPVVGIEDFMENTLPQTKSVEILFIGSQSGNLVTLMTADNKDSKPIFKWDNNYSWTYRGNLAGKSIVKENVKKVGGNVEGHLRFSITWNEDGKDRVDFDAHAIQPDGIEIYYNSFKGRKTTMTGSLDVDMIRPSSIGVENIFWVDKTKVGDGKYSFFVKNYDGRKNKGLKAEIEISGKIFSYVVTEHIDNRVDIAEVYLKNGELDRIIHKITPTNEDEFSQEIYELETEKFHKVNLVCLSPNYWENNKVGNKHFFFMIPGAKSNGKIRGFHNEFLRSELLEFRKIMDTLGEVTKVESEENQLSGLGFNATVRDEAIVRLDNKKVIKIKF